MSRATQNLLLLLVGVTTGLMIIKGTYLHYVKPALLPWLIIAAVVLVTLAVSAIVRDLRQLTDVDHPAHQDHSHRTWMAWLLLVPITVIAFVVPPPLGAHGAAPQIAAAAQPPRRAFPPLPPGESPTIALPEVLLRAATDSTNSLVARRITVTGFTMKEAGGTDLGRVVIVCCAADAQLARIHLAGPAAPAAGVFADDTWLQIQGTVDPTTSTPASQFIPTMTVSHVQQIDKPKNTYSY